MGDRESSGVGAQPAVQGPRSHVRAHAQLHFFRCVYLWPHLSEMHSWLVVKVACDVFESVTYCEIPELKNVQARS